MAYKITELMHVLSCARFFLLLFLPQYTENHICLAYEILSHIKVGGMDILQLINVLLYVRMLQGKLEQPISNPPSPADFNQGDRANNLSSHIQHLRDEVARFREQLTTAQEER